MTIESQENCKWKEVTGIEDDGLGCRGKGEIFFRQEC